MTVDPRRLTIHRVVTVQGSVRFVAARSAVQACRLIELHPRAFGLNAAARVLRVLPAQVHEVPAKLLIRAWRAGMRLLPNGGGRPGLPPMEYRG